MIRIIIADDQLLFRSMLEEMLRKDKEIEILASVSSGEEAVALSLRHAPDVVLLDVQMPGKGGIDALREIKKALPATRVALLTTFENPENIKAACQYGADGYLVKDMKPDILLMAIKCIYNDIVLMHGSVYSLLLSTKSIFPGSSSEKVEFGDLVFDPIDIIIMKQIADGKTNKDIAHLINYSEGTIKNRVSKILGMTGLSDRTEITVFALKNQII
ncbi:MAG: response regulator transcription factor [Clostridiales bacterium]|nr:response regulator transcription factor [Clostridiales bacterium]